MKMNLSKSFKSGFTLIELLVVVAIIGILASVVLAALNSARNKGVDAGVKSNLANARAQAGIFYDTTGANTYTGVCTVNGVNAIDKLVLAAAKASGLSSYNINGVPSAPSASLASCNNSASAWAAEAPLKTGTNQMWCVDSTGASKQVTGTSFTTPTPATDYLCN